jgi:hypothetical protein
MKSILGFLDFAVKIAIAGAAFFIVGIQKDQVETEKRGCVKILERRDNIRGQTWAAVKLTKCG